MAGRKFAWHLRKVARSVLRVDQPDDREIKRRARAAWSHSGMDQKDLAAAVGIPYGTLKGLLRDGGTAPSIDQALAIARACDVPDWFILHGWTPPAGELAADRLAQLEAKYDELAGRYDGYLIELREIAARAARGAVAAAMQTTPASAQETAETDRPRGQAGDDRR